MAKEDPARLAWPDKLNPSWDAIGSVRLRYPARFQTEWLLVEAKAHTNELQCDPNSAAGTAKDIIRPLLHQTRDRISRANQTDWIGTYYQAANRLFTLDYLIRHGVPARLLLIYFYGDRSSRGRAICPASAQEWQRPIHDMYTGLGVAGGLGPLADRVHTIFLPVSPDRGTYPLRRQFNWPSPRRPRRPRAGAPPENPE